MEFDVSVVVRAKDAQSVLMRAAESVLTQDRCSTELVIVDDCSSDGTARVAAELSLADIDRVRVVSHMETLGRVESYRSGLKASRGPRVLFMDAEDILAPHAARKLVEAADESGADVLATSLAYVPALAPRQPEPDDEDGSDADTTGALVEPQLTVDDVFSDEATGAVTRVVSPLMQTLAGHAIADALFKDRTVPVQLKGRLFSTELARRAFAEIEHDRLAERDEAAASFITATMAETMAVRPDLRSIAIAEEDAEGPLPIARFEAICANRTAVEVAVDYLNRCEQWESYYEDWEGLALMLCSAATSQFPARIERASWQDAADALVNAWGAPYLAAALDADADTDLACTSIALASARALAPKTARPERLCLLVHEGDDPGEAAKAYDALSGRKTTCLFLCDEGVQLDEAFTVAGTLPRDLSVLDRARLLAKTLEECRADALVFAAGPRSAVYDALVARSLGLPVALIARKDPETATGYCDLAAQVAMSTCVVPKDGVDAELWSILGTRIGSVNGLVSQLALGTTSRADADSRELACRLVKLVRGYDDTNRTLRETTAEAISHHDRMEAEVAGLKDRIADLEKRLDAACAERDELHASLDELQNAGVFKKVFGLRPKKGQ